METRKRKDNEDDGNDNNATVQNDTSELNVKRIKLNEVEESSGEGEKEVIHPLLVEPVLDQVFSHFRHSSSSLKELRLVCKLWDTKASEILREKTEIDVKRLVSPYPEGLIWMTGAGEVFAEHNYVLYSADPVEPIFENLKVVGTCETLTNVEVINWFERMGSKVKSFHFNSSLSCFHQTRFLECVLKRWCKNLSRLHLEGFIWNGGFNMGSRFNSESFLVDHLKEIVLNSDSNERNYGTDCVEGLGGTYLNYTQFESMEHTFDMKSSGDSCGVWENILRNVGSEKLLVKILPPLSVMSRCVTLFPHSVMSQNQVRFVGALKNFEYQDFLMFQGDSDLNHFREIKFPITKLCLGPLPLSLDGSSVTSLLESLSGTLQHLEFHGDLFYAGTRVLGSGYVNVQIPLLPNLRYFKNGKVSAIRTASLDFVYHLPKLEKCSFQNGGFDGNKFNIKKLIKLDDFPKFKQHGLEELELIGKIKFGTHVELIGRCFPFLKSLVVKLEGKDAILKFADLMQILRLEEVKIRLYTNDDNLSITLISRLCDMHSLRFLEIVYVTDSPFNLSWSTCKYAFARAPNLTSLKLKNVSIFFDERARIRKALSHIGCVSLTNCVFQVRPTTPTNLEFCVGSDVEFPPISLYNIIKSLWR